MHRALLKRLYFTGLCAQSSKGLVIVTVVLMVYEARITEEPVTIIAALRFITNKRTEPRYVSSPY